MPFLLLFSIKSFTQNTFTVSGTIKEQSNNEPLIGAAVFIVEADKAVITDEKGNYSIGVVPGKYTIEISFIGYNTYRETINVNKNLKISPKLENNTEVLQEIVITEQRHTDIRKPEMSVAKLTVADIKKMPVVLGETDLLKSILQLPGVTDAGEGTSGFNVRGGSSDQNLILLDEATIYNSSHLYGFFSVFNSDAIKDLKLYKGGIPSRFGGRLSSVLEIKQREGNYDSFKANGGIGLISSRFLAEGPIEKNRASFLVAGRASYAHLFLKLTDNNNAAYFYDLNSKISYKINEKNSLFLSAYFGRDILSINEQFRNSYGNTVVNLKWNHQFSSNLYSGLSLIYSDYYYGLDFDWIGFNWESDIKNLNLKYDFKHRVSESLDLSYGVNANYYTFNPGILSPSGSDSGFNRRELDKKYAFEPAFYIEAEKELSEKLSFNVGLRYSLFYRLGSQNINVYENNRAVLFNPDLKIYEKATPVDTRYYGSGDVIADFGNLEPRVSLSYQLNANQSVKASYNRMIQYLHLISNTNSATPLDVWAPSDDFLKPQKLDQYAVGYFQNLKDNKYSLEIEAFYKEVQNKVDYIDGADLIANNAIEQVILNGEARSYGLEFLLRKNFGNLSGWIAYTLSKSEQRTPGRTAEETGINEGEWYLTGYDKTHNLAITASYQLNDKWSFGSNFTLQTGRPVTFPNGRYEYGDISVPNFHLRNENRLPAYHHLDVSATYVPKPDKKSGWQGEWVFSIYNLYNRKNAASISFRQNENNGISEAVRLSIFGIVPSVTYNFKF